MSIVATQSLDFRGSGNFKPAAGGLGGLADISADQILVVDTATRDAIAAPAEVPPITPPRSSKLCSSFSMAEPRYTSMIFD